MSVQFLDAGVGSGFSPGRSPAHSGAFGFRSFPFAQAPFDSLGLFAQLVKSRLQVLTLVAGGVPCVDTLDRIVADGVMLVGDAAHQVNPMTGGGILNGMIAGKIAGQVAAEAVRKNNVSEKKLRKYSSEWHKKEGRNNELSYRIQQVVNTFSDEDLNKIAHTVNDLPSEKRTIFQIFKTALLKHPKLILDIAKVIGSG